MTLVLVTASLAACVTPAPSHGAPHAAPPLRAAEAADEWTSASWEERHATMTWGVLPAMARRFQAFRNEPDPSLTCRTCHGSDAEDRAYAMPSRALVALSPDRVPGPDASPTARFMHDEVVPTMRDLTGDSRLSCFSCHPRAGEVPR